MGQLILATLQTLTLIKLHLQQNQHKEKIVSIQETLVQLLKEIPQE